MENKKMADKKLLLEQQLLRQKATKLKEVTLFTPTYK